MPSARTSTVSVNSSRERVAATLLEQPGMTRPPTTSVNAHQRAELEHRVSDDAQRRRRVARRLRPPTRTGSSTSTSTVKRSSTSSQPTATCPAGVWSASLSASTRSSTTVLATEIARPNTMPAARPQPNTTRDERAEPRRDRALNDRAGHGDARARRAAPRGGSAARRRTSAGSRRPRRAGSAMCRVGDEPGVYGPTAMPGEQVADDRREPQPVGEVPEHQRRREPARQRQDEVEFVGHREVYRPLVRLARGCRTTWRARTPRVRLR